MHHSTKTLAAFAAMFALAACEQESTRVVAPLRAAPPATFDAATIGGAIDLGTLGGRELIPFSINDKGVALGLANDASGQFHSWESVNFAPIASNPSYLQSVDWGEPRALNDAGAIAGWHATADGRQIAFLATPDGVVRDLTTPATADGGAGTSEATAINSTGDVAGWYVYRNNGDSWAAIWKDGGVVTLGSLAESGVLMYVNSCEALAINDGDEVAGVCADSVGGHERAFVWSPVARQMTDLGVTGAAVAINNSGVVAGYAVYDADGDSRAFVWRAGGPLQYVPLPQGVVSVQPAAINDHGIIAGQCSRDGQRYTACAGSASGTDWFVSDIFEMSSGIVSINDDDVALGFIEMPDAPTRPVEWPLSGKPTPTDATPPVVTPTLAGTLGLNGWYTSDVALTWTEMDPESQVASTSGCDPVTVSSDTKGASFTCSATNGAGLTAQHSVTIQRDATPPSIGFGNNAGTYTVDQSVAITCSASDATSGLARTTCGNITGDAYTFALGANTFSAIAVDVAGNVAHASTSFVVKVTFGSLGNLTRRWVSNVGVANSLVAKLDAAAHGNAQSKAGKLGAYVNELQAQTGKTIAADEAAILERLAAEL